MIIIITYLADLISSGKSFDSSVFDSPHSKPCNLVLVLYLERPEDPYYNKSSGIQPIKS